MKLQRIKFSVLLALISLLTACAGQPRTGLDYYLLSSAELSSQSLDLKPFKLALGPIDVPIHLNRQGIAIHESQNKLTYSDTHRWAEPLNENLTQTLYADFAQLLPNQQLIEFPYKQSNKPDYQLIVNIEKFGFIAEGKVVLVAHSAIVNAQGKQLDSSYIKLERSGIEQDYTLIVSAMSSLLGQMALELASRFSDKV